MLFFNKISIHTHVFASLIAYCKRDPLRANKDYYLTAEIDVLDQRTFQYIYRFTAENFKPVSAGLAEGLAFKNKALTKGE